MDTHLKTIIDNEYFKTYRQANSDDTRQKAVEIIITQLTEDPEDEMAAQALIKIAQEGDPLCTKVMNPLREIFWQGDFEWQESIIELLGEVGHLTSLTERVELARFLGHVAVSDLFIGGSGVDYHAIKALEKIGKRCGQLFSQRLLENQTTYPEVSDIHLAFKKEADM